MSQQTIGLGAIANDGTGDDLRAAGDKINDNFTELYAAIPTLGAGVATFLTTPSSANLSAAVTGETGTGALVFATSPTLVSPVLGVASGTNLFLGTAAGTNIGGLGLYPPVFEAAGTVNVNCLAQLVGYSNDNFGSCLAFAKSQSGTFGAHGDVEEDQIIGIIQFFGSQDGSWSRAADLRVRRGEDSTAGAGAISGYYDFRAVRTDGVHVHSLIVSPEGGAGAVRGGRIGVGCVNFFPERTAHFTHTEIVGNAVFYPLRITFANDHPSNFANGVGVGMEFETETGNDPPDSGFNNMELGGILKSVCTDITLGSEDFDFSIWTMTGGAAATEKMRFTSDGGFTMPFGGVGGMNIFSGAEWLSTYHSGSLWVLETQSQAITMLPNSNLAATFDASGNTIIHGTLRLGTVSSVTGQLLLANSASANLTTIRAGNAAAAITYTWPTNVGAAGSVLTDAAGNGTLSWAAAGGSITGSDTQVLFFDGANNPAGDADFTYNKTSNTLSVGAMSVTSAVTIAGGGAQLSATTLYLGSDGAKVQFGGAADATFHRVAAGVLALTDNSTGGASFQFNEQTAPTGSANSARLYAQDNGSGKTQLMVIFGSGAGIQIAIEV